LTFWLRLFSAFWLGDPSQQVHSKKPSI
jgi:hypothetical protein